MATGGSEIGVRLMMRSIAVTIVLFLCPALVFSSSEKYALVSVAPDGVLFSGDIIFEGRVLFVGDADTKRWLQAIDPMQQNRLKALIPGHDPAASKPNEALAATRDYLVYLRQVMGAAVEGFQDFSEAYEQADW